MTRTTRKTVCAITFISFVVAVFAALCFATKGFTVWDANKWFNYWGHGEPVTVAPDAQAEEQQSARIVAASNSGVIHDSDDATATVSVQQIASSIFEYGKDGVTIICSYPPLGAVTEVWLMHGYGNFQMSVVQSLAQVKFSFVHTIGGQSAYRSFLSYASMQPCVDAYDWEDGSMPCLKLKVQTVPAGVTGVTASDIVYSDPIIFPTIDVVPELNGTVVTINGFENVDIGVTESGDHTSWNGYNVHVTGESVGDCWTLAGDCDCDYTANYTLCSMAAQMLSVDLTQLSFVDTLGDYTVEFFPVRGYSNRNQGGAEYVVALDVPTVSFSISRLPSPTNIAFADGKLTWTAVDGSNGYYVGITANGNDHDIIVETNEADVSDIIRRTGDYTVRVRALGNVGKALAASAREVNAFNAGNTITRMTLLTFDVDGDTVSKFVPYGVEIADYLYDVELDGKQFSGWYYDTGFSRAVTQTDKITGDVTIYARLTVLDTQAASTSWWSAHKSQVILWSCVSVGALIAIGVIAAVFVKRKGK